MGSKREIAARIREVLDSEGEAVSRNAAHHNSQHYAAIESFDAYERTRQEAREIKEAAIESLPDLIDRVEAAVKSNGGHLHVATDAREANEYVESVLADQDGETVVKSKSMTTEEIGLRAHLESVGADVYETDLGEFVVQLAEESPSHIVGPALHKTRGEIADLFNDHFDPHPPLETPTELTEFARAHLGEKIETAALGVTGANFVLAESGSIVLVTNEGNARKSAVVPDTHVAVAGIEKLIPSIEELHPFNELIARSATGQDIAQYVSVLTPPVETPTIHFETDNTSEGILGPAGDREFHLVLLDNGRFDMRADPQLRETLYCIRCGACLNACANFQQVGGHAFGGDPYVGGIGAGWVAGIDGTEAAGEFTDFCTGCSRCVPNCPVKIDIPWLNTVIRDRKAQGTAPDVFDHLIEALDPGQPGGYDRQKRVFGSVEAALKLGSTLAPVSNWVMEAPGVDRLLEATVGIDRRRSLPHFSGESFREWWEARDERTDEAAIDLALYVDPYTNYLVPSRGRATVRVLEALGYRVHVPTAPASGRAPLSQGMIRTAESKAQQVLAALEPHLRAGRSVVVIEPSDLAMFRRDYGRLLEEGADRLAASTVEVFEFLVEDLVEAAAVGKPQERRIVYHSNCQQRTLDLEEPTVETLRAFGFDVRKTDVECCGMAGSFGYKEQFYELSMAVGEDLGEQLDSLGGAPVYASGFSCLGQIESLLETLPEHPIELVESALDRSAE